MRLMGLVTAAAILAVAASSAPLPAAADGSDTARHAAPVRHHARAADSQNVNVFGYPARSADPYAYSYEPRPWYPYYNSAYWVARSQMKARRTVLALPPYYATWGYPVKCTERTRDICSSPGDRRW